MEQGARKPKQKKPTEEDRRIELLLRKAVDAALDRKALEVDVLKVEGLTSIADYFVICSGTNERQTQAIADAIEGKLREGENARPIAVEGTSPGRWILMDYGDFIVHIFTEECRDFYALDRLWGDAPNVTGRFVDEPDASTSRS